ncbi:hypothetical protein TSOC_005501, partial [Tetrabaena socialis]
MGGCAPGALEVAWGLSNDILTTGALVVSPGTPPLMLCGCGCGEEAALAVGLEGTAPGGGGGG